MVALVKLSSLCHVTVFCGSSSCSCGLVCIVLLWYFLTMLTYFCMLNVKRKTTVFAYKYSKCLDVCTFAHSHPKLLGAQWLSGNVHV